MIVGVAIKHKEKTYRLTKPHRHIDIIHYLRENTPDRGASIAGGNCQGFYIDDEAQTFLTREDAMTHAKIAGQITTGRQTLFSEDLW